MSTEISKTDTAPLKQHLSATIDAIEKLYTAKGSPNSFPKGISTGFYLLDIITHGLIQGQVTVIASCPAAGRLTLAMNIAEHVAVEQKIPVGFFSIGCCAAQLVQRMLFSRAQVVLQRITEGFMGKNEATRLTSACTDFQEAEIFIEDPAEFGLEELRVGVKRFVEVHNVGLIVIDHLDLMGATWKMGENRAREIAEISSGIKTLAEEFKISILVLADLTRGLENLVGDHLQKFSDPQLSAPIARFADVVCFLERKDAYFTPPECEIGNCEDEEISVEQKSPELAKRAPATVSIAKNRNGLLGNASLVFLSETGRFESWQPGDFQ